MPVSTKALEWVDSPLSQKKLTALYGGGEETLRDQRKRYHALIERYKSLFPDSDLHLFSTPGRTEIGGNHTDHNLGRVLAASVNLDAIAAAAATGDGTVTLESEGYGAPFRVRLDDLSFQESEKFTTAALIRGIAAGLKQKKYRIGGFNACISSRVMVGSGLSSSASVEVLIGTIFNAMYNKNEIPPETLAMIGQYAENAYFGKPCGLMDQMTCAVGGFVTIDFRDPGRPEVRRIPFDFAPHHVRLLVVDTGGSHADLTEDYASIPREMRSVAGALGGKYLRDVSLQDLFGAIGKLRGKTGDRAILRALHFFMDNERVLRQVEALENNDFERFLELVNASGSSSMKWLQNCYAARTPHEQGVALALALSEHFLKTVGKGACRVHGGGFAGTIQVFIPEGYLSDYTDMIERVFGKNSVKALGVRPAGALQVM